MNFISRPIIMAVLAFVFASGGVYGSYRVLKDNGNYGSNFEERTHMVSNVVDGDTFVIVDKDDKGDKETRVRLLGINAPELGSCYGEESKKELARLMAGRRVVLDRDEVATDGYGRVLRYAFVRSNHPELDDVFVTVEMVKRGAARAQYVPPNKRYLSRINAAEREAIAKGRGLWKACEYKSERGIRREEREVASETFSKECVIKGNLNKRLEKDYFLPGCPNYKRVKVDPRKGERWFCSEADAKKAGWSMSDGCRNIHQFRE